MNSSNLFVKNRMIRIAIVGCGRISKNHFSSIEEHSEDIQLVSICDTDPTVLGVQSAIRFNCTLYSKWSSF